MKKLLFMFAATVAFVAFATLAQAQTEVVFPFPDVEFLEDPPASVFVGQEFSIDFHIWTSAPGTTSDVFEYAKAFASSHGLTMEGDLVWTQHDGKYNHYGTMYLTVTGKSNPSTSYKLIYYPHECSTIVQ